MNMFEEIDDVIANCGFCVRCHKYHNLNKNCEYNPLTEDERKKIIDKIIKYAESLKW